MQSLLLRLRQIFFSVTFMLIVYEDFGVGVISIIMYFKQS